MNDSNQPTARDLSDVRPFADRVGEAVRGGGFWMDGYWVWCGTVAKGEDDRYHMFAARWPKDYPFFQGYTAHSEIVRAVELWVAGAPVPGTERTISDEKMLALIRLWATGEPIG